MKVLTITTDYLPKIGGISSHIYYLNRNLARIGVEPHVLHIVENSTEDKYEISFDEFHVHKLYISDNLIGMKKLKYRNVIKKILIEHFSDVDIIHTHELFNTEYLVDYSNYKWVWTNHTSRFNEFVNETGFKSRVKQIIERNQLKHADRVVCVSKFVENNTVSFFSRKKEVAVIPNGIELERFDSIDRKYLNEYSRKLNLPKNKTVVLIVARWFPVKGIHIAIDAMNILKERYPSKFERLHFVFAGAGDSDVDYRKAQEKRISEFRNYTMLDLVTKEDMPFLYNCGDIVLIPSLYESAPVALLEAMGSKRIVLAAKVGGLQYNLKDGVTGFFFERANAVDLVEKLLNIESCDQIDAIRKHAFEEVCNKYTWDQVARQTKSIYDSVL
ncbi:glycosyltransferase family 4 protein [Vibrio sp. S4M6]|uniref:glycosyltransferase family 4 protein n=1 Tax=Vibrio sinus TaxID=2946865 RepID=UPI00202AA4F5|nr:glycosyltransferase family 4 protein [Vibrio sinus]MCL9781313.1 glycosyltransferase family 4 protein [Vibrio sinus]